MTYCKISLKEVSDKAKYADYQDAACKALFNSTKVNPVLPFTRSEFMQESIQHTEGMSISGVQQKLSLKIDDKHQLVPVSEGGEYILKPSPEEFPNAAENEHTAMVTSRLLDISTAACGLVTFDDGELAYISKRFDRLPGGGKQHQEDLAQGFEMNSEGKYGRSYEAAGQLILDMTNGKAASVRDFIFRVIHAYLIGNDDMHLKNISLQKNTANTSRIYDRLTPNYDCLFTSAFKNISQIGFLALDLLEDGFTSQYAHYGYYTGKDFIELGRNLDIPTKVVVKFIRKIAAKEQAIKEIISNSYMPSDMKKQATETIAGRTKALIVNIDD